MATCRECRQSTPAQHKLGCSRRRQSGSYVNYSDETAPYTVPFDDYAAGYSGGGSDSGSSSYDSGSSSSCDTSSSGGGDC